MQHDDTTPGIGHNKPPEPTLEEQLEAETAEMATRARDLAASAGRVAITDEESAGRATLLAKMMVSLRNTLEEARVARVKPFLDGQRAVNGHFRNLDQIVALTDTKGRVTGGPHKTVLDALDQWAIAKERAAAAEKARLEAEARAARKAAEEAEAKRKAEAEAAEIAQREAQRKIDEMEKAARAAGDAAAANAAALARAEQRAAEAEAEQKRLANEIEAADQADEAARLELKAAQTVAAPTRSSVGGFTAFQRTTKKVVITNWKEALTHCLAIAPDEIKAAIQAVYDRQLKAKVTSLPGADILESKSTSVR